MADKCPSCGEKDTLTFSATGGRTTDFMTSLTLGPMHGDRAGITLKQVACANCHQVYLKEVRA